MLVTVAQKEQPNYILLALIPTFLFLVLDAYYLALEKGFRDAYNDFVTKIHSSSLSLNDLYAIKPNGNIGTLLFQSFMSFSVWGFYVMLGIMIGLARWTLLRST